MPVYNVEKYVKAAIESVLNQTFQDFECIIINDGSTDNSLQICQTFTDARINIVDQKNRGVPGARNTGIRCAKGELIAFIDSDDIWMPNFLYEHVTLLAKNPAVGLTYNWSSRIDSNGQATGLYQLPRIRSISNKDVLCETPIGNGSCVVVRRTVFNEIKSCHPSPEDIGYFNEKLRCGSEDYECWLRIKLTTNWKFAGIATFLTQYRINLGGQSKKILGHKQTIDHIIEKTCDQYPELMKYKMTAMAYKYRYLLELSIIQRQKKWAIFFLSKSVWLNPFIYPLWTLYLAIITIMLIGGLGFLDPIFHWPAGKAQMLSRRIRALCSIKWQYRLP